MLQDFFYERANITESKNKIKVYSLYQEKVSFLGFHVCNFILFSS